MASAIAPPTDPTNNDRLVPPIPPSSERLVAPILPQQPPLKPALPSGSVSDGGPVPTTPQPERLPPSGPGQGSPLPSPPQRSRRSRVAATAGAFVLGGVVASAGFVAGQLGGSDEPAAGIVAAPTVNEVSTTAPTVPVELGLEPVAEVAGLIGPSVVQVETPIGQGSGVVYADGLILTNHHVIDGAQNVRIRTSDGRVFDTDVLGSDPRNDIAVLAAPGADIPAATVGSSADLAPGQLTVAIGSPFQLQQTVTAGIVSSVNRPVPNNAGSLSAMIQTDAPINPGNSGGALANREGELIGINASIRTDGTSNSNVGIGFAVPIDTAIAVADRIVGGESLEPGVLGVSGERQDSLVGVPIAEVTPGSAADEGGLEAGDRVLTIDGVPVTDISELTGLIQSHFSGETIELEIERDEAQLTVVATLS